MELHLLLVQLEQVYRKSNFCVALIHLYASSINLLSFFCLRFPSSFHSPSFSLFPESSDFVYNLLSNTTLSFFVCSASCTVFAALLVTLKLMSFPHLALFPVCFLCSRFTCMLSFPLFWLASCPSHSAYRLHKTDLCGQNIKRWSYPSNHHLLLTLPLNHRSELLLK